MDFLEEEPAEEKDMIALLQAAQLASQGLKNEVVDFCEEQCICYSTGGDGTSKENDSSSIQRSGEYGGILYSWILSNNRTRGYVCSPSSPFLAISEGAKEFLCVFQGIYDALLSTDANKKYHPLYIDMYYKEITTAFERHALLLLLME